MNNKPETVAMYISPAQHIILVRAGHEGHPLLEGWTFLQHVNVGNVALETAYRKGCFYDPSC